jgi:hypothetical protein
MSSLGSRLGTAIGDTTGRRIPRGRSCTEHCCRSRCTRSNLQEMLQKGRTLPVPNRTLAEETIARPSSPSATTRLAKRDELGFDPSLAAPLAAQVPHRPVERVPLTEAPHQLADSAAAPCAGSSGRPPSARSREG